MANFLGAAFGFGARDVGLKAATNSATKNLDKINDLMDDQEDKGSKIGKMWKGMGERIKQFNIASIASNMRSLTGETGNLTNGLEAMGVSYSQAAKPIIASMDLTGREAKKMTGKVVGMAIGLNTSADAVANTFKAIHDAGGPAKSAIDAMGMSEKDWVKVTQTTGVEMQDFSAMMGDMVASWGASPKQAAMMTDNIMAIGKAAKVGTSAIKGAKGQLDALDAIFESLPPTMARSADEVQSLMESTYKLAGAFKEMGETEEGAVQLGQDTAKMFAEQAVMIEKLYEVGGDQALDDSPLFKFLTQIGIGTNEARDIIDEGSKDVVGGVSRINDIFATMGGDSSPQVQYALGELNKAMGQSATGLGWLASNTDTGTKSLAAMAAMSIKGEGALKKYGDQAYSSGRTLQESFDLAKESFETQVRSIARGKVGDLVGRQMKAYRRVGKELKELGSDETWGPLMNAVSIFDQMGPRGVFLALSDQLGMNTDKAMEMGIKFEYGFDKLKQFGEGIAPIMEILGMFGPLGPILAAGGIVSLFVMDDADAQEILGGFYDIFNKIKKMIMGVVDKVPWDKVWAGVSNAGQKVWTAFTEKIPWKNILDNAIPVFKSIASALLEALVGAIDELIGSFSSGELVIGGAIAGAFMMGGAFGPFGAIVGLVSGALVAGTLSAIGKLEEMDEKNRQARAKKIADEGKETKIGVSSRNEAEREKRKKYGVVGEKVTAESILGEYKYGGLEEYQGRDVGYTKRLRTRPRGEAGEEFRRQEAVSRGVLVGDLGSENKSWNRVLDNVAQVESLPEVQERLAEAQASGGASLARELREVSAEYASVGDAMLENMLDQASAIDLAIGELEQLGVSEMGGDKGPFTKIIGSEGGGAGDQSVFTEFDARAMESTNKIHEAINGMNAQMDSDLNAMAQTSLDGGAAVVEQMGAGFSAGGVTLTEDAIDTIGKVAPIFGHSLPTEGPLGGTEGQNPAYFGGRSIMEQFAEGITDSTEMVRKAITKTLDDSIIVTLETYQAKMEEMSKNKSLLKSVAKQMVRDFGGELDLGKIQMEGEQSLDAKQTFEAALNIPGLAGVIAAIASDGHKTRVVLKKIWDDTHVIATSDLVSKTTVSGAGAVTTTLA